MFRLVPRYFHKTFVKMSTGETSSILRKYTFEQLQKGVKERNIVIIDVRERNELKETGKIPDSINIPIGEIEKVFSQLSEKEFENEYGQERPKPEAKIVVSCLSGKRSAFVQKILQGYGFQKVYNYEGGWSEWAKKSMS